MNLKNIKRISFVILVIFVNISMALAMSSDERTIQKIIIKNSINNYPGFCVCPYSLSDGGGSCDYNSAYYQSKNKPFCYSKDVTYEMVDAYRRKKNLWSTDSVNLLNRQILTPAEMLLFSN